MSLRDPLFNLAKRMPKAVRMPLRSAWHRVLLWRDKARTLWQACYPIVVFPRMLARLNGRRRVLGIFHFQEHAGFLGDMMEFLQILNVVREKHGLEYVDICYVDDRSNPNRPVSRQRLEASPEFKPMMLELRHLLPGLGSVLQFNSDADFEVFFRSTFRRYVHWPRYGYLHTWPGRADFDLLSADGLWYPNHYAPLYEYYDSHERLPSLRCPPEALSHARDFIARFVTPAVPVVVQIRVNAESPERNTDVAAWFQFFERMGAHPNIKFVLISRIEEILPEFEALNNVVYSKRHSTGVLEDLALIQSARLSLFPDAGFATFPWFCGRPTIFFGKQRHDFPQRRMMDPEAKGPRFLSEFQRRRLGPYDATAIEEEFWKLWNDLEAAGWTNPDALPDPTKG